MPVLQILPPTKVRRLPPPLNQPSGWFSLFKVKLPYPLLSALVGRDLLDVLAVTALVYLPTTIVVSFVSMRHLHGGGKLTLRSPQISGEYPVWEALRFPELH